MCAGLALLADNIVLKVSRGKNKRSLELYALFNYNRAAEMIVYSFIAMMRNFRRICELFATRKYKIIFDFMQAK